MKRIRVLALMMVTLLVFAACGENETPQTSSLSQPAGPVSAAEPDHILRVGMECDYAPFNWTQADDGNGAVALGDGAYAGGYDVEIAKRVAAFLDMELVIVKSDWDSLPSLLTSGKIDAVIAGMTNTEERRQTIEFTDDYYTSDLVLVVKKDGPYAGAARLGDFSGARITGQLGTLHYTVIDQIPDVQKEQAMKDFPTMVEALLWGDIDGYVSERPGALSAVAANPALAFISFEEGDGFDYSTGDVSVAVGMRKGDTELTQGINEALASISEGERARIMEEAVNNQPHNELEQDEAQQPGAEENAAPKDEQDAGPEDQDAGNEEVDSFGTG